MDAVVSVRPPTNPSGQSQRFRSCQVYEEKCFRNSHGDSQASSLLGQINEAKMERRITPPTTRRVSMIGMG